MRKVLVMVSLVIWGIVGSTISDRFTPPFTASALSLPPQPPPEIEFRVEVVQDGDTVWGRIVKAPDTAQDLPLGELLRVRYIGINAPELSRDTPEGPTPQECLAKEATTFHAILVQDRTVYLELDQERWDDYGRLLAYVYLDPLGLAMANAILVAHGYAAALRIEPNTRYAHVFTALESAAIRANLGLWGRCVISWEEATEHVDERIVVEGQVASVGFSEAGRGFLNLGNPYPETPRFTVVIEPDCLPAFEARFGDMRERFEGRVIRVYGKIILFDGIPEIKLCNPNHLWIPQDS